MPANDFLIPDENVPPPTNDLIPDELVPSPPGANQDKERSRAAAILNETGWYTGTGRYVGNKSGRPDTEEEQKFILDFWGQTGRPPTYNEIGNWKYGKDTSSWTYLPGSTMFEMGYRQGKDYSGRENEWGPYGGSLVPTGGLVLTDKAGNPVRRIYDRNQFDQYIKTGQYIKPSGYKPLELEAMGFGDVESLLGGGHEDINKSYPQSGLKPWKEPTMEEALATYAPQQIYNAKLEDYLTQQLEKDAPRISQLQGYYDVGKTNIEQKEVNGLIDAGTAKRMSFDLKQWIVEQQKDLMTEDKAKEVLNQADALISKGVYDETLPFFKEASAFNGPEVAKMFNEAQKSMKQAYEKGPIIGYDKYKNPIYSGGANSQIPVYSGQPGQSTMTGRERQDFAAYASNMNVAPEWKNYLFAKFNDYYNLWGQSGRQQPFIEWLEDYLASGGKYAR